jgi:exopolyphosphatase/guanosine-5'-triphosphate,3'-diphosphate pyrophosphatase
MSTPNDRAQPLDHVAGGDPVEHTILEGIVPRWEWRTFGHHVEVLDAILDGMTPDRVGTSHEQYFLSLHNDSSAKVRDAMVDVKALLAVDDGLELWAPVLKAEFPVAADVVVSVLRSLGVSAPELPQGQYSLGDLVGVIDDHDDLTVVTVEKHRRHFQLDGCTVEATVIVAGDRTTRTVAVESPDPAEVVRAMQQLGLAGRANVNVARGLKSLVGFGSTRLAVIDVGTNSVKFHLVQRWEDGTSQTLVDRADMTRLGEGQSDDGVLADAPMGRTVDAIATMVEDAHADGDGDVDIVAVGTAGLRRAPNRSVLIDAVRDRTGVAVEVIAGPEEARLAYLAATSALPTARGSLAVFDSGGGSTQFTFGRDGDVDEQFSVDVGAVRVAEPFGLASAVSREVLDEVFEFVGRALARLDGRSRPDAIVAIGGTSTNLAAVSHALAEYDPDVVHGTVLDVAELDRQIELYRATSADERRSIPGLQAARAEVILGGACIVRTVLAKLGHDRMTVSDRGLRHGVVIDRFPPEEETAAHVEHMDRG